MFPGQQPFVIWRNSRLVHSRRAGALFVTPEREGLQRGIQWQPDLLLRPVREEEPAHHPHHGLLKLILQGAVRE